MLALPPLNSALSLIMEVNSLCRLPVFSIYIPFMCLLFPEVDYSFTFLHIVM